MHEADRDDATASRTMTTFLALAALQARPSVLAVHLDRPGASIPRSLYGVFFEEINAAGEGGLYGEMLRNRGLEAPEGAIPGWTPGPGVTMVADGPNAAHPRAFSLPADGEVSNAGWDGLAVAAGEKVRVVVWAKGPGRLTARLGGAALDLGTGGEGWRRLEGTIVPGAARDARFTLAASGEPARVAYASAMPDRLWKGRRNGLRPDLAEKVAAMRPGFVRFPGGCFVEGGDRFEDAFDWRSTVGPVDERRGLAHSMWGYPVSNGLGYHEYLQWCEDLGAAPLFVVNAGVDHQQVWPMADMDHWVRYALDAIEYANGPTTSKWGALRAKNGHPKPFGLKYVEIGNENGGWFHGGNEAYAPRYRMIYDAIKARYPEIVTIADWPTEEPTETVDEHYYSDPAFFWKNAARYDAYPRTGPRIYVGEYAVTQGAGKGNLAAALGEAAFMTGMERNADVVRMASYAPLLTNVAMQQWGPDAIPFDASRAYGTPSYYVQTLFARNRPDRNVAVEFPASVAPAPRPGGGLGLMTWNTSAEFRDVALNVGGTTVALAPALGDARGAWSLSDGTIAQTSLDPDRFVPLTGGTAPDGDYTLSLKARAVAGKEGFLIVMDLKDGGQLRWNVGGWDDTATGFERNATVVGDRVPVRVEPGRWMDVRLERRGGEVRGYLDGRLVQTLHETGAPDLAAVAGVDERTRELVIKVVNGSDEPRTMTLDPSGGRVADSGTMTILTGPSLLAENSFAAPTAVAPVETRVSGRAFTFPPRSVTVLRLPIR